jgi:hypothetical protein
MGIFGIGYSLFSTKSEKLTESLSKDGRNRIEVFNEHRFSSPVWVRVEHSVRPSDGSAAYAPNLSTHWLLYRKFSIYHDSTGASTCDVVWTYDGSGSPTSVTVFEGEGVMRRQIFSTPLP